MKKNAAIITFTIVVALIAGGCASSPLAADAVPRISKEEVKARMGAPDLILLDTRTGSDWKDSDQIIQGALRADPREFSQWAEIYPKETTIVLY